jgi:hypothetical protein
MKIEVEQKSEFGNARFYATNKAASVILSLMGRKSFTLEQIKVMKSAEFEIIIHVPKAVV